VIMHTKNILVGLLSLMAVAEASAINRPFDNILNRRAARSLQARQDVKSDRFGGQYSYTFGTRQDGS
jgi:transcription initiation factor TFIID subunit 15